MRDVTAQLDVAGLLARFDEVGGVLDYVFLDCLEGETPAALHRQAALRGMASIGARLANYFRVRWDESKLSGGPVEFSTFWGTEVAELVALEGGVRSIPPVDGYESAFFFPPHDLYKGSREDNHKLFADINRFVLGDAPERAEIYAWSTDWSNYFDAGHEFWGAFYWTIRPPCKPYVVAVGASSTD